jgi:hypothetical protein
MGLKYLNGKTWAEVTRDERFFCQHLYSRIQQKGVPEFIDALNRIAGLQLPRDVEWEPGFEVCFYRDFRKHMDKSVEPHSNKRTFDLCLFSEDHIVIIEAKAQQGFEGDPRQVKALKNDKKWVRELTEVEHVFVIALASSQYLGEPKRKHLDSPFDGEPITWKELAEHFDGDDVLRRADNIYEKPQAGGQHNQGFRTGEELAAANGETLFVGRNGGINGKRFREDIKTGRWKTQPYETASVSPPASRNWFPLTEFLAAISHEQAIVARSDEVASTHGSSSQTT